MSKPQSASKILKEVTKVTGIRRIQDRVYNENTLQERKASVYTITLTAPVMNSEWDSLTLNALLNILRLRFRSQLETIFVVEGDG